MKTVIGQAYSEGVAAAFAKFAGPIKSNARMTPRTKGNVARIVDVVPSLDPEHRQDAKDFVAAVSPEGAFDVMHSMRRWYSGQTMARKLLSYRDELSDVMRLSPADAIGSFRGFKVDKDHPLASSTVGQRLTLPVTRNHGFSSWSTTVEPTNKFSGGGKGKVGLIVKLVGGKDLKPVLAPPDKTDEWFNQFYAKAIGSSFRPKEQEYLVSSPSVDVEVVRVKK